MLGSSGLRKEPQAANEAVVVADNGVAAPAPPVAPEAAVPTPTGTAEKLGLDCAKFPATSGKVDVLGVPVGMAAETAFNTLACANPAYVVEYSTNAITELPTMPDGSLPHTAIKASADGDDAIVYLMGLPGSETVVFAERDIAFPEGKEPAVTATVTSLAQKYGAGIDLSKDSAAIMHSIVYSTKGTLLAKSNPLFSECAKALGWGGDSSEMESVEGCGLTINYRVERSARDQNLAGKLYVILSDQDKAVALVNKTIGTIEKMRSGAIPAPTAKGAAGAKVPSL